MLEKRAIIALGNAGEVYQYTRHNAGFIVLDQIAQLYSSSWHWEKKFQAFCSSIVLNEQKLTLIKPQTMMNLSGQTVQAWLDFYQIAEREKSLLFMYDDLDLPFGTLKLTQHQSPTHNGVLHIKQMLGEHHFFQLRLGIDDRQGERTLLASNYVLQKFTSEQIKALQQTLTPLALEKIKSWL